MSCSEVMYQAYYPYLYQRPGATPAHPVSRAGPFSSPFSTAHQYDRFNVQRLQDPSHSNIAVSTNSPTTLVGRAQDRAHASASATAPIASGTGVSVSYSTCNSSAPSSPRSHSLPPSVPASISLQAPTSVPIGPHKEDSNTCVHGDESCCSDEGGESPGLNDGPGPGGGVSNDASSAGSSSRAQYISANCVVFTHYHGDAAAIVDEHFTKALDKTHNKEASSPMSTRNFPPSFWNSAHQFNTSNSLSAISSSTSDGLYHQSDGGYLSSDWYHQYSQYHHHHHHQHHHHSMAAAASYGSLLLPPPGSRLHMSAAAAGAAAAQCKAIDWQHAAAAATLDNPYSSYPSMSGLEAQVQESSKDLYWF